MIQGRTGHTGIRALPEAPFVKYGYCRPLNPKLRPVKRQNLTYVMWWRYLRPKEKKSNLILTFCVLVSFDIHSSDNSLNSPSSIIGNLDIVLMGGLDVFRPWLICRPWVELCPVNIFLPVRPWSHMKSEEYQKYQKYYKSKGNQNNPKKSKMSKKYPRKNK